MSNGKSLAGFTLIEVMVAVVVVNVVALALAGAILLTAKQFRAGGQETDAWSMAYQQMEQLRAHGFANLQNGNKVIEGDSIEWTVSGTDAKKVILVVRLADSPNARADTFVTYLAEGIP